MFKSIRYYVCSGDLNKRHTACAFLRKEKSCISQRRRVCLEGAVEPLLCTCSPYELPPITNVCFRVELNATLCLVLIHIFMNKRQMIKSCWSCEFSRHRSHVYCRFIRLHFIVCIVTMLFIYRIGCLHKSLVKVFMCVWVCCAYEMHSFVRTYKYGFSCIFVRYHQDEQFLRYCY